MPADPYLPLHQRACGRPCATRQSRNPHLPLSHVPAPGPRGRRGRPRARRARPVRKRWLERALCSHQSPSRLSRPAAGEDGRGRSHSPSRRDETVASTSTLALSARGLPAGAWSQAAESVDGTSNDTVGSTSNGNRSNSDYAGGGDAGLLRLQLREDHAAAAGAARLEAQDDARAGNRPAAGQDERGSAAIPSGIGLPPSSPRLLTTGPADGRAR